MKPTCFIFTAFSLSEPSFRATSAAIEEKNCIPQFNLVRLFLLILSCDTTIHWLTPCRNKTATKQTHKTKQSTQEQQSKPTSRKEHGRWSDDQFADILEQSESGGKRAHFARPESRPNTLASFWITCMKGGWNRVPAVSEMRSS